MRRHLRSTLRTRVAAPLAVLTSPFTSGEYFTRWSLILSFVAGTFLSVPSVGPPSVDGYLRAVAVAALGWAPLALCGLAAAYAERHVARSDGERAAIVIVTILGVSGIRPFLNEGISQGVFGLTTGGNWGTRITTNIVTAGILFTVCAIAVTSHRRLQATTDRLRRATARMRAGRADAERVRRASPALLEQTADDLRRDRDDLLAGPVDYDRVRDFATRVRSASHRLDELGHWPAIDLAAEHRFSPARSVPLLGRLHTTPRLTVGLTYVAATAPFGIAHGGVGVVAIAVLASALLDLAAGAIIRRTARVAPRPRGLVFLAIWALVGVAIMVLTFALIPDVGALGLVPLLGMPLTAAVISMSGDAYRRARAAEARATSSLGASARSLAAAVDAARAPLRRAGDLLHGRLQGRCVILAAHVDEHIPDEATLAAFRDETDAILRDVRAGASADEVAHETLDDLIEAWSIVLDVRVGIQPEVGPALDDDAVSEATNRIVNEALVNAVKHSGARWASVDLSRAGDRLRVRIASPGALVSPTLGMPPLRRGLGTRASGTTLQQIDDQVVLEGVFDLPVR